METNDLKIFYEVAQLKSTSKAADKLNYVQSTVSKKIAHLENQLEKKLFYRTNRGMSLTENGERFLNYATQILTIVSEMEEVFHLEKAYIRVGGTQTITKNYLQQYLLDEKVSIFTKTTADLIQELKAGMLDFILVNKKIEDEQLQEVQRVEEKIVWTQAKTNSTKLFENKILISRDKDCPYRKATLDLIKKQEPKGLSIIEVDALDSMTTMLETQKTAAILPEKIVEWYEKLQVSSKQVQYPTTIYVYAMRKASINKAFKLL